MKKEEFKDFIENEQPKEMGLKDVFKGIKLDVNLKESAQKFSQGASDKVNSILAMRKKMFKQEVEKELKKEIEKETLNTEANEVNDEAKKEEAKEETKKEETPKIPKFSIRD